MYVSRMTDSQDSERLKVIFQIARLMLISRIARLILLVMLIIAIKINICIMLVNLHGKNDMHLMIVFQMAISNSNNLITPTLHSETNTLHSESG